MNRRKFLGASGMAGISAFCINKAAANNITSPKTSHASVATARQANNKPNIIWFHVDEQRPDSLGCYGSDWAKTPNLDRLATMGAVFRQCHVQSPICSPSRTSQLFCRYPQDVGVYDNKYFFKDGIVDPNWKTFPQVFAENGYRTFSFGKWHTPNHPTWQENTLWQHFDTVNMYGIKNPELEGPNKIVKRPKASSIVMAGTYPHDHWGANSSTQITDASLRWMEEAVKTDQPFFMRLAHLWPHTPVLPPNPWDKLYEPDEIPYNLDEYAETKDKRSKFDQWLAKHQGGDLLDEKTWRWVRQCYYGLCSQVDNQVGRVLHRLEELGLMENTIVIYSSDHGTHLGEYGCCEKNSFDSEVWRVPMIIAGPGIKPSQVRTDICEAMDLGPTLLSLAGLETADGMNGRDLFNSKAPDAVFGIMEIDGHNNDPSKPYAPDAQGFRRVAVRTKRYRCDFNITVQGGKETANANQTDASLYDTKNDPLELNNLSHVQKYAPVLNELIAKGKAWCKEHYRPNKLYS